jgi:hypothetical protein
MKLSEALSGMVSPEELTQLTTAISRLEYDAGVETVTSGALSVTKRLTLLSVTGTQAYTLANGTYVGQRKSVYCTVAASTPAGTLTPATLNGGDTLAFNAVSDSVELMWDGAGWQVVNLNSVVIA